MTESRVEAVARAIAVRYQHNPDKAWDDFVEDAQAAIEASDAWLKEQADGVAEQLNEIQTKSVGLTVHPEQWAHMREMKSEKWHIAMINAKNAIAAVTSLAPSPEETDR